MAKNMVLTQLHELDPEIPIDGAQYSYDNYDYDNWGAVLLVITN